MKHPKFPKKVSRQLSGDESLQRYFRLLRREFDEYVHSRAHIRQIVKRSANNVDEVMQVERIIPTDGGVVIHVR